jgi:hypothetical protein
LPGGRTFVRADPAAAPPYSTENFPRCSTGIPSGTTEVSVPPGTARLALLSGAIRTVRHFPLICFPTYGGAGPLRYSLLVFVPSAVGAGLIPAWLRLRSGSVITAIILVSGTGFFLFGGYRRGLDTAGSIQYALAGIVFGMSAACSLLTIPYLIQRFYPPTVYEMLFPLSVIFALFAVAVVVVTTTGARRDLQEMKRRLETVLSSSPR